MSSENSISNKIDEYFRDNIKLSFVSKSLIIIVTKDDKFYKFDINLETFLVFNIFNEHNVITTFVESNILNELCFKRVIDFNFNSYDSIVRTIDGQLYFCESEEFQGFNPSEEKLALSQYLIDEQIVDMCSGISHSLVLTNTGEVYAWGENFSGQLGIGCYSESMTPIKVNGFNGEKIIQISCGYEHSMALTESGRVFSWGCNEFSQLGLDNDNDNDVDIPTIVLLSNEIPIKKISCGQSHSLLLSQNGDIYWCGDNGCETRVIPEKLKDDNKFIDIASHYYYEICVAQTEQEVYFWGLLEEENEVKDKILAENLKQSQSKTIEKFFNKYFEINYKPIEKLIDFKIKKIENGKYGKEYEEKEKLGEGCYGQVFRGKHKDSNYESAIKKIEFKSDKETELLKEVQIFYTIKKLFSYHCVRCSYIWLENNSGLINSNDENLILYIQMELCDTTLKNVINQMIFNSFICQKKILTLLGYYIASYIFVEILKGVNYLHKRNPQILHCDLHSENILFEKQFDYKNKEKYRINVKISDFGLAKICELALKSQTVLPKISSRYSSSQSDGSYTLKNDIFALGDIWTQLFCIDPNR
jgi:hypothetical protein